MSKKIIPKITKIIHMIYEYLINFKNLIFFSPELKNSPNISSSSKDIILTLFLIPLML